MRYPTVLLDLDHTLLDSDASEAEAFRLTMSTIGIDHPAPIFPTYQRINRALWAAVERGDILPDEVKQTRFEQLLAELNLSGNPSDMATVFVNGLATQGELYPGARELLASLAGRCTLAMVTNGISFVQRTRIDRLELAQFFDVITVSAEVATSKPGPRIFEMTFDALEAVGRSASKDSTVMVGDSLSSDIKGGTGFGIDTVWFNPHRKSPSAADVFTHEIERLDQLPDLVFSPIGA